MNSSAILLTRRSACFLAACVFAAWTGNVAAQAPRAEATLGPAGAFVFVHVRPVEIWKSDAAVKLRQQYPAEAALALRTLEKMIGLPINEVESVSYFGNDVMSIANILTGPRQRKAPPPAFEEKKRPPEPFLDKKPFEEKKRPDVPFGRDKKADFEEKKEPFGKEKDVELFEGKLIAPNAAQPSVDNGLVLFVTTRKPFERATIARTVLAADLVEHKVNGKTYFDTNTNPRALHFVNNTTYLIASSSAALRAFLAHPAHEGPNGPLGAALELAGKKHHVVVGLNFMEPSAAEVRKELIRDAENPFPRDPLWAVAPLLQARSAALALDLNKDANVHAILAFPEAAAAAKGADAADDGLQLMRILGLAAALKQTRTQLLDSGGDANLALLSQIMQQLQTALRQAKTRRTQANVEVAMSMPFDVDALRTAANKEAKALLGDPALQLARTRQKSIDNLKQFMLAMHSYYDVNRNKGFPAPAICSKTDGKPLLSWRVAILPYLDEAPLYNEFKLDEPWDSPHNIKLLPRMPKVYAPIGIKTAQPYTTFYQVLTGPGTVFEVRLDPNSMHGAFGAKLTDVLDGTSNTIGIVEASDAVPWTKPADLVYDAKKALPKMGGTLVPGGFNAGFADGTARFISDRLDEKTIRALITRSGGEPIDLDRIERP